MVSKHKPHFVSFQFKHKQLLVQGGVSSLVLGKLLVGAEGAESGQLGLRLPEPAQLRLQLLDLVHVVDHALRRLAPHLGEQSQRSNSSTRWFLGLIKLVQNGDPKILIDSILIKVTSGCV
jgi:hypothetical protein